MKEIRDFVKELRKTTRGKAIIKLSIWLILFAVIMLTLNIVSMFIPQNNNSNPVPEKVNIINILNNLSTSNYDFTYNIVTLDNKYLFEGSIYNDMEKGYKETNGNIIKYQIEDNESYQMIGDYYEPISDVYENIDINYLKPNKIVELISDKNYSNNENEYSYIFDNITITFTIENKIIYSIKINTVEGLSYEITIKNINNVNEIKSIKN